MIHRPVRLLLISTSTVFGTGYLEHAFPFLQGFLGSTSRILFIPYALKDHAAYTVRARAAFGQIGYTVDALHEATSPRQAVDAAEAFFCGGGNTFRLLTQLCGLGLLEPIRERVRAGALYAGASAGANLACPTIRTTNDMPIVEPPSLRALGLVPFQINPHFIDADPSSRHMGETRETRIREFHEENDTPVVGLREGAILDVTDATAVVTGLAGARIFRRGGVPEEAGPGTEIRFRDWL